MDARRARLLQSVDLAELGARIRAARVAAGLTQAQLGGPEATVSYVSRIESGARRPDPRVLDAFASRLGIDVGELLAEPVPAAVRETELAVDLLEVSLELGDPAATLTQAEELLDRPDLTEALRERVMFLHGRALESLGRLEDAITAYEDLLTAHPRGRSALACGIALSRCYREGGDLARAIGVGEQLLSEVEERGLGGLDEVVQLTVTVAAAYFERSDVRHAVRLCRDAIAVAERTGSARSRASAYWNASIMELEAGRGDAAVGLASRALALLSEQNDGRSLARLRSQLGIMQMQLDPPELDDALANLTAAAEEMELSGAGLIDRLRNELALAEAALVGGELQRGLEVVTLVLEQAPADTPLLHADALRLQGELAAAQGDTAAAARLYTRAVHFLTGIGADRRAAQRWLELGALLESVGDTDAAREAYRSAAASTGLRVSGRAGRFVGR